MNEMYAFRAIKKNFFFFFWENMGSGLEVIDKSVLGVIRGEINKKKKIDYDIGHIFGGVSQNGWYPNGQSG